MDQDSDQTYVIGRVCNAARSVGGVLVSSDLVFRSLNTVLEDKAFRIPAPRTKRALEVATSLVSWCGKTENRMKFVRFSSKLVSQLKTCFQVTSQTWRIRMEMMWKKFHALRTSNTFNQVWEEFFSSFYSATSIANSFPICDPDSF